MFGSVLMLVAILWVGFYVAGQLGTTFSANLQDWYGIAPTIPLTIQSWMFLAFALSFAIKVPMFPLHTWLPDAHVEAPTAGSVILAGVLLKMGTYGFLRFCIPLFPAATLQFFPYMATIAIVGIIYGALVSMVQTDMKKLVAYSSVSHLGFVVLGIFSLTEEAVQGGIIQMINHGLSTGALFIIVGMIYDRRHTRQISEFGGVAKVMPIYATFFMIVSLSSIGLPGLNGFVGEFLILLGSFRSEFLDAKAYAIFAATGVILAAVYLLWMYQRVMFGSVTTSANTTLKDLSKREILVLVPLIVFIVWIGVYPSTFLKPTAAASKRVVQMMEDAKRAHRGFAITPRNASGVSFITPSE
jgi:NADH-quinone oxidoreductase subunit M